MIWHNENSSCNNKGYICIQNNMIVYNKELLSNLLSIGFHVQPAVGDAPAKWAIDMGIQHEYSLPSLSLSRSEVKDICTDEDDVLKAYLIVMAWGGQGRWRGGKASVSKAWRNRDSIKEKLLKLKNDGLSREESYNLFSGKNSIPGLGPAFFTKLLYFFRSQCDCYIMDKWTTRAILLLTNTKIIKHYDGQPSRNNTSINYENFCLVIEDLANKINASNGDEVEQRLFSNGKSKGMQVGQFRQLVKTNWANRIVI